jgi:hypothetical protein
MRKKRIVSVLALLVFVLSSILMAASNPPMPALAGEAEVLTLIGEGAVCPPGNVKLNIGSGYEYSDGSATITGDANSITVIVAPGHTLVSICIKIGGPGGGSTIFFYEAGTYGPFEYGISHVVVTTTPNEPTCEETIFVLGTWSDWFPDPQREGWECHVRTNTWFDAQFPEHVCAVEEEIECREIPEPGEPSLITNSHCIDATTMEYESIIHVPEDADLDSADLWVMWYYPNGTPFVTGPTFLGTVPLVVGDNYFNTTMTKDQLIAAIDPNNLSGGNPANDVNYDQLDQYTYQLGLFDGEGAWFSNIDYLWENCGENGGCCKCPTCGDPVFEKPPAIGWVGTDPCTQQNCEEWYETYVPWVIVWYTEVDAASMTMQETEEEVVFDHFPTAMEGVGCTMTIGLDTGVVGDQILWGPEGYGDRIRDHLLDGRLNHFSMCSLEPDWCPHTVIVDSVGYFRVLPGTFESRIYAWLMANEFFPDLEGFERREAARLWAAETFEAGNLWLRTHYWLGDLSELPLYELPPR